MRYKFFSHFGNIVFVTKNTKYMSRAIWFDKDNILNHVVDVNDNFKPIAKLPEQFQLLLQENGWFGFKKEK